MLGVTQPCSIALHTTGLVCYPSPLEDSAQSSPEASGGPATFSPGAPGGGVVAGGVLWDGVRVGAAGGGDQAD